MEVFLRSPNWIGDCVMAIPAIRALKDLNPEIKIVLVTKISLKAVFENIREIDRMILISGRSDPLNLAKDIRHLKSFKIRTGLLFTNSFISAFLFRLAGVKALTGYIRDMRGFLLKKKIRFPGSGVHQKDFYMELVKIFTEKATISEYSDRLEISKNEKVNIIKKLSEAGINPKNFFIGISPFTAYGEAKQWPAFKFSELINKIKNEIVDSEILLFGAPSDKENIKSITRDSENKTFEITDGFSLREAITTISLCRVFISNDSGLLHVASALNIPAIGIFGPTLPEKTAPTKKNVRIIYKSADCSPCKHRICPIDHRCMASIGTEEVYSTLHEILN
ncbi:MAG: lipopolysaccharide heptosyltransferase II [Acidobacteriota bacterium]